MNRPKTALAVERILVPTDFSERADGAFSLGLDAARRFGAELILLHAIGPLESDAWSPLRYSPEEGVEHEGTYKMVRGLLERTLDRHDTNGVKVTLETQRGNAAAPTIVSCAEACSADLIVMGTHGRRGLGRVLMGSVAEEVVRTATCPVLLAREGVELAAMGDIKRIMVPLDFSPRGQLVLPWARLLASVYDAHLVLMHVVDIFPMEGSYGEYYNSTAMNITPQLMAWAKEEMEQVVKEMDASNIKVSSCIEIGQAAASILDEAGEEGVDLLIMSSHGRTGFLRFLLGSVAEKVTRTAPCPVLVIRAKDAPETTTPSDQSDASTIEYAG